jgi:hypothetical protein
MTLLSIIKKSFKEENMFEQCDVICHVTVAFYIYHFMCDTLLDAHKRQLHHLCTQQSTKVSKELKKSQ